VMPIKEEEQFGEYLYYEVIDLNAINLDSWCEISRVNEEEDKAMFFASHYLTDELDSFPLAEYEKALMQYIRNMSGGKVLLG